jgi:archaellum component FlaD/FlaE
MILKDFNKILWILQKPKCDLMQFAEMFKVHKKNNLWNKRFLEKLKKEIQYIFWENYLRVKFIEKSILLQF